MSLTVGELQVLLSGDPSKLNRELDRIDSRAGQTERTHSAAWGRIGAVAGAAIKSGMVVATGAVVGLGAAIKQGLNMASFTEQAEISFGTLLGSAEAAKAYLGDLQKFAAATPFELPGVVHASRQLLGVGQAAETVIPTLTAWGDTAGALGLSQEQFGRVMTATTQSMAKGKIQAEELMQITEAGIPIYKLLSDALGLPVPEIQKLASEGKLLAEDVFPLLEKQMQKDYGGSMAKQAGTLSGLWSTAKDSMNLALKDAVLPLAAGLKTVLPGASAAAGAAIREMGLRMSEGLVNLIERGRELHETYGPEMAALGEVAAQKWGQFTKLLSELGSEVAPSLPTLIDALVRIAQVGGEVGEAMLPALEAGLSLAGPAAEMVAGALTAVASVLETIEPILPIVVGGFLAFKGLSAVAGIFGTMSGALGGVKGRLTGLAQEAAFASYSMDGLAGRSAGRVSTALGGAANAVGKMGAALPVLGIVIAGIGMSMADASQEVDKWAQAILDGGAAAAQARKEYADNDYFLRGLDEFTGLASSMDEAQQKAADLYGSMSPLQRAQQDVTNASNDLAYAQERHGKMSFEAMSAAETLTAAEDRLERKQLDVENATRSVSDALADQVAQALAAASSDLMLSNARLGVQDATARYNEVLADGTATAGDRQRVENDLAQSYYNVAGAALKQAEDQATLRGETLTAEEAARIQIDAMQTMATEMGGNVPASVSKTIGSLQGAVTQADLVTAAANGVTGAVNAIPGTKDVKVNGLTEEARAALAAMDIDIEDTPDGTTILHANTDQAQTDLDNFMAAANKRTATVTIFQQIITGKPQPGYGGEAPSGGNPIGLPPVPRRASGGPVWPGQPFFVGEEGKELFVPDVPGTIIDAKKTAAMLAAAGNRHAAAMLPGLSGGGGRAMSLTGGSTGTGSASVAGVTEKHYHMHAAVTHTITLPEFMRLQREADALYG